LILLLFYDNHVFSNKIIIMGIIIYYIYIVG